MVEVRKSKCGYKGIGEIVSVAYGSLWLVKISAEGFPPIITVRFTDMAHSAGKTSKRK